MATLKEISIKANVSTATVSNVLNDSYKVKDATKAKVLKAIQDLKDMKMDSNTNISENVNTSKVIGVIVEDITVFNTPKIISAICDEAQQEGYSVLICNLSLTQGPNGLAIDELECVKQARYAVNLLISKAVDGIIYVGSQSRELKHISSGYETDFVYAYCYSNEAHAVSVVYDDETVTYQLIRHLIDHKHSNIGIVAGPEDSTHVRNRLVGFQKALYDSNILFNPGNIFHENWDNPSASHAITEQLIKNEVTAIFCMNDMLAAGVLKYARENNINVPKQLSVVGFDNIDASKFYHPRLTTVSLPLEEIGKVSVKQLLRRMNNKNNLPQARIVEVECKIVFRESVADAITV